jgi:alpha-galactosidase
VGLYKEHRDLIHSGRRVHADVASDALLLHGVVAGAPATEGTPSPEGTTAALFALVSTGTSAAEEPGRIGLPGLDAERSYRVEAIFPAPGDVDYVHTFTQVQPPAWLSDGAAASGRFLAEVGLPMPILNPEHALLLKVTAL